MFTDLTIVRALFTLLAFSTFIGIVAWAWSSSRRTGFDEAAALPFDDDLVAPSQGGRS